VGTKWRCCQHLIPDPGCQRLNITNWIHNELQGVRVACGLMFIPLFILFYDEKGIKLGSQTILHYFTKCRYFTPLYVKIIQKLPST
jgi:hypothetical protein